MTLLWVTLFLLHPGYALVPVITVPLGEPVTLTCAALEKFQSITWLHWYKQTTGDTLKLVLMHQKSIKPTFEPEFPTSRFSAKSDDQTSELTILRTIQQDEGMYHCAHMDWTKSTWSGMYLSIKGDTERTLSYSVVQRLTESDPADPGTLQCSVLSDFEDQMCSEDPSVFWFKARSKNSHPDIMYTDGNRHENCDNSFDSQRRCRYKFSKKINSSDSGTYYCAVATCGHIFIGSGTNLEGDKTSQHEYWQKLVINICLAISVIINIVFLCHHKKTSCKQLQESSSSSQERQNNLSQPEEIAENAPDLSYAALHFSDGKSQKGTKTNQLTSGECVYSRVKTPT